MTNSRQRLLDLIRDLLDAARPAACETDSLGRIAALIFYIDLDKARSAAIHLKELGYSGDAIRLTEDVRRIRQRADELSRGPFVATPTPDDQEEGRRKLAELHHEASRLVAFLRELEALVAENDDGRGHVLLPFRVPAWAGLQKGRDSMTDSDHESGLRAIATDVALLVREHGIERLRKYIRQAAKDRLDAQAEKSRRRQARRDLLAKHGIWHTHQELPASPDVDHVPAVDTFCGQVKLPANIKRPPPQPTPPERPACIVSQTKPSDWNEADRKAVAKYRKRLEKFHADEPTLWKKWEKAQLLIFKKAKDQGFPDHKKGSRDYEYIFTVRGWVPQDLSPDDDPDVEVFLPDPDVDPDSEYYSGPERPEREVSLAERGAGLCAIHDGCLDGEKKIGPCSADDTLREREWYGCLVYRASRLRAEFIPDVQLWLRDVQEDLTKDPKGRVDTLSQKSANPDAEETPESPPQSPAVDDSGVTVFDVAFAIEEDDKIATQRVKKWSDSGKITAQSIGKCPLDGRRSLYRLSELLSDVQVILSLSGLEKEKYHKALAAKQRLPRTD